MELAKGAYAKTNFSIALQDLGRGRIHNCVGALVPSCRWCNQAGRDSLQPRSTFARRLLLMCRR